MVTLRALQSAANHIGSEAPMTWKALNASDDAPGVGYKEFAARWETDPILKQLVDRFDANGLVIKTDSMSQKPEQGKEREGNIARMAKHATKKAFN